MVTGTFAQQLNTNNQQQPNNRSQQLILQQKQRQQQARYDALKSQAQQVSGTFVDTTKTETYIERVPDGWLDRQGNISLAWYKMTDKSRNYYLAEAKSRGWGIKEFTRTRTITTPFTMQDYSTKYESLSPDLKPFFIAPTEITSQQATRVATERNIIVQRVSQWQIQLEERKQYLQHLKDEYNNKTAEKRRNNKESYRARLREIELEIQVLNNKIGFLSTESGKVSEGYSSTDLINYAENRAENNRVRLESKDQVKSKFNIELASGKLDETLTTLGIQGRKISYDLYNKSIEKYNIKVNEQKLANKRNAEEYMKNFPSEKLLFNKEGTVIGVESGAFGKSIALVEYNKQIDKIKTPEQLQLESTPYLSSLKDKANKINYSVPTQTFLQENWDKLKALRLSTPFGNTAFLSETNANEILALKKARGGFYSPYSKSLAVIKEDKASDYRAKIKSDLNNELNLAVSNAPTELKSTVQEEGMKLLKEKGMNYEIKDVNQPIFAGNKLIGSENVGQEIVLNDKDFERKISTYGLELENAMTKKGVLGNVERNLLAVRQVSLVGAENILIGKGIGKVFQGGKWIYQSLGAGYKIGEIGKVSLKTGTITAELLSKTPSTVGKIAWGTAKYTAGAGLIGIYGYAKYQQLKQYKASSEFGGRMFATETAGELIGIGTLVGGGIYNKYKLNKLNKQIAKENLLVQQRTEAYKNLNEYGKYAKKTSLEYKQKGFGKLSVGQRKLIAKKISSITGASEEDAFKMIKEDSFYTTTQATKDSSIPSIKRALKTSRTGKSYVGSDTFKVKRIGVITRLFNGKNSQEVAFEFNLRGNKLRNLQIKTTVGTGKKALTNVFEKVRYSKKSPENVFKLRETVLTKVVKQSSKEVGQTKFSLVKTENRLFKINPLGNKKLNLKEALRIGLEKGQLNNFENTWETTGKVGTISKFRSLRVEAPLLKGGKLKVGLKGEYKFGQVGVGNREVPLKNLINSMEKQDYFGKVKKIRFKPSKPIYTANNVVKINKAYNNQGKSILKDTINQVITKQEQTISPTVQTYQVKTRTNLKDALKVKDSLASALAGVLASKQKSAMQQRTKTKQDLQMKQMQLTQLKQDLQMKQMQQQAQKSTTTHRLTPALEIPRFDIPTVFDPTISTPPSRPRTYKFAMPSFDDILKKKIKKKIKSKSRDIFGLMPDFTSKILGFKAKSYSLKDSLKAMRKVQTGFELRTGGRIIGKSDKDIMKGIMQ